MKKPFSVIKPFAVFLLFLTLFFTSSYPAAAFESLTYLYGSSTSVYLKRIENTRGNISIASPDYFEVDTDGSLKYTKTPDPLLLASLKSQNIKVIPFLSNHWNRSNARKMLANRWGFAKNLADAAVACGCDGLDIDIQNINEADRTDFTDFIRLLRNALPDEMILTVCVPANPYYTDIGWQGGYDYTALSKYCDHIFIMTYDESFDGGEPGPVASYWFIETSIKYAISKQVPLNKIMIGIPFYGRFWTDTVRGAAFTVSDIESLVSITGAGTWYDYENDCARATVVIPEDTTITTWGGRKVGSGVYDIWYENSVSWQKKISLVRKYGIRGVGSWALGQEPPEIWGSYAAWLSGYPFRDIEAHWAQNYIIEMFSEGIIKGKTSEIFAPEDNLTRAEACALLVRLAGITNRTRIGTSFADTAGHWAEALIGIARDVSLVTGVSDTEFRPDNFVTREEFVVMAERYTNITDSFAQSELSFSDVSAVTNPWSNLAIIKLAYYGVLNGYEDNSFHPGDHITRAQAAKVISKLRELPTRFVDGEVLPLNRAPMSPR